MLTDVTSPDGVRIACEVGGEGTPLVMVHGAGSGRWSFDLVRPHLEDAFRSGRSTGAAAGTRRTPTRTRIEREFDDVAAVVREAGDGALLFGHSYGGLVAAGAAARLGGLPRLALYEGPMGGVLADEAWTARFEANLEVGQAEQAMRDFMSDVGGYTDAEIEAMQGTPAWRARIAAAPTVPRELHAEHAFAIDDLRLGRFTTPTAAAGRLGEPRAGPSARPRPSPPPSRTRGLHVLEGHGHGASVSGPELLASELRGFLAG